MTTDTVGGVWTFTCELAEGFLRTGNPVALVSFGRLPSHSQLAWSEAIAAEFGSSFHYEASPVELEWMEGGVVDHVHR